MTSTNRPSIVLSRVCHLLSLVRGLPTCLRGNLPLHRRYLRPPIHRNRRRRHHLLHLLRLLHQILPLPTLLSPRIPRPRPTARRIPPPRPHSRNHDPRLLTHLRMDCTARRACSLDMAHHWCRSLHARDLPLVPICARVPASLVPIVRGIDIGRERSSEELGGCCVPVVWKGLFRWIGDRPWVESSCWCGGFDAAFTLGSDDLWITTEEEEQLCSIELFRFS